MNYRIISSTVLFFFVFATYLSAQLVPALLEIPEDYSQIKDSLIIERTNGMKIHLTWPYMSNFKKSVDWQDLLADFQRDFKKVTNDVPEYDFYHISYIQNSNLIIEEIRGKETYTVSRDDNPKYIKSNSCKIKGKKIELLIEFNNAQELLDPLLKADIEAAASKVKHVFYWSTWLPERHYFSIEKEKMLPKPKPKLKLFAPVGARLTYLKNRPNIELRYGLGLLINKKTAVGIMMNHMLQYSDDQSRTFSDIYLGIKLDDMTTGLGSEFGFMVKNGIQANNDIFMRAGINYRSRGGINLGVAYYLRKRDTPSIGENLIWDFKVGFGF